MRGLVLGTIAIVSLSVIAVQDASAQDAAGTPAAKPLITKAPAARNAASKRTTKASPARAQSTALPNGNYNWTGFYGGANAGYLWGTAAWTNLSPAGGIMNPSLEQGMLGAHLGVQYNTRNAEPWGWVFGAEFAFSSPLSRSSSSVACVFDPTQTCRARLDDLLTVGGRLGLSHQSFLLFGTGGYARANVATEQFLTGAGCNGTLCDQSRARGWYAGAGLEYMLLKGEFVDVIIGIEWQHLQLDAGRQAPAAITARDVDVSADIVRARLSLKFNPFGNGKNGDYKIDW